MRYKQLVVICLAIMAIPLSSLALDKQDMGGWEKNGAYNNLYDINEMDTFKATVVAITTVVPLPGMSPGVALLVREADEDPITVHVCPLWFAKPGSIGVRKGDRIKLRGAWAEIDGKDVFLASKIKKGDNWQFKVRLTSDGTPFWTMKPEEMAKERDSE
jgi:hypothetical protein